MSKLVWAHTHTPHYTRCGARRSHCYLVQCPTHKRTVESKVIQYTKQARDTVKSHPTLKTQAHGVNQPYTSRNTHVRVATLLHSTYKRALFVSALLTAIVVDVVLRLVVLWVVSLLNQFGNVPLSFCPLNKVGLTERRAAIRRFLLFWS